MEKLLSGVLPTFVFILGAISFSVIIGIWKWKICDSKNPLTIKLSRVPGESLQQKIRDMDFEIMGYLIILASIPLLFISIHLSESYLASMPETISRFLINFVTMLVFFIYNIRKLFGILNKRENYRLGLDGERATGQELNKLYALGYKIYHDIPVDDWNIDHIVVGHNGVFVIETKGRSKKKTKNGKHEYKVAYDGNKLKFSTWEESEPIEQVKRNSKWLANELTKAIGEPVKVESILCVPGWFIKRLSNQAPFIFNGKDPENFIPKLKSSLLEEQLVQRIAYQIEQWVSDVQPSSYKKQVTD